MNLTARISTAVASTALMMNLLAPAAFADTSIIISNNGKNSDNNATVNQSCTSVITQSNSQTVGLDITSKANTGGNKANGNTGSGDVTIDTGNATSNVTIKVEGGSNEAPSDGCCNCVSGNVELKINGNLKNSNNNATSNTTTTTVATQLNGQSVTGAVKSKAKTGKNKANNNGGGGNKNVTTGNANSTVNVTVTGTSNVLTP